jgi:hypothetical protein
MLNCNAKLIAFAGRPKGLAVREIDVRHEFYKRYAVVGVDDRNAKLDTRSKAYRRAVEEAISRSLIWQHDDGLTAFLCFASPADEGDHMQAMTTNQRDNAGHATIGDR